MNYSICTICKDHKLIRIPRIKLLWADSDQRRFHELLWSVYDQRQFYTPPESDKCFSLLRMLWWLVEGNDLVNISAI